MDYQHEQAIAILRRTPATVTALLQGLPDVWTMSTAGPATWSAYAIVGHLLAGEETDWIARTRTILEHGDTQPFDTFDRTAMLARYHDPPLDQLLTAFEQARMRNLATLSALQIAPEQLARTGIHPELGRVTLSQLLATWVVHDLNHIGQIVEVLSRQYAEAVGPWSAYLHILTRPIITE